MLPKVDGCMSLKGDTLEEQIKSADSFISSLLAKNNRLTQANNSLVARMRSLELQAKEFAVTVQDKDAIVEG